LNPRISWLTPDLGMIGLRHSRAQKSDRTDP
jgi:hypothetical protein